MKITKKKNKWVQSRNIKLLRGTPLHYNAGIQAQYMRDIKKLIDRMSAYTLRQITILFNSRPATEFHKAVKKQVTVEDADIASQARILTNALVKKFNRLFGRASESIVEKMLKSTSRISASNLNTSLKKISGGLAIDTKTLPSTLKTIIKAATVENTKLIKSIGADYISKVQRMVMRSIVNGEGLATLEPALKKFKGISDRHAKNMALDQTRKVYNAMNKERMADVGVTKYEWRHSGGSQKPRQDHIAMSGNIYSFAEPPVIDEKTGERGIPGQAINCRCFMIPVVEF